MNEHRITITSKGQITIPAEFRRSLGLKTSDQLTAKVDGGSIVLTPEELTLEDALGSMVLPPGVTLDNLEQDIEIAIERETERLSIEFNDISPS